MEENANKLHFECIDFNSYMRVAVHAECIFISKDVLKFLCMRENQFFVVVSFLAASCIYNV